MKVVLELFLPAGKVKKKKISFCFCVVCQPRTAFTIMWHSVPPVTTRGDCWKPWVIVIQKVTCEGAERTPCPAGMEDVNEGRKVGVDLMQREQNKKSDLFIERRPMVSLQNGLLQHHFCSEFSPKWSGCCMSSGCDINAALINIHMFLAMFSALCSSKGHYCSRSSSWIYPTGKCDFILFVFICWVQVQIPTKVIWVKINV